MIYFRDYQWLTVEGYTQFAAHIGTNDQKREDVFWTLNLRCVAGGPEWRRVQHYERPSLWLEISSFNPKLNDWTDLERLNFWNPKADEEPHSFIGPAGLIEVDFYPEAGSKKRERSLINDAIWRVAGREGGWFTVEFAGFANGLSLLDQLSASEVPVAPDGREVRSEPGADFWKQHAELYLVESVPFGTVTVGTPRNVRDPEAYALRRAQQLIGVPAPEHIVVRDHLAANRRRGKECPEGIQQDVFVEMHFNGFYES